jgi:hypothetical protein
MEARAVLNALRLRHQTETSDQCSAIMRRMAGGVRVELQDGLHRRREKHVLDDALDFWRQSVVGRHLALDERKVERRLRAGTCF